MKNLTNINPGKIAIFRALQLGDLLCAIPAVRSLKSAFPHSEITLIGLPWAGKFVKRYSNYFSGFIEFPGYPGLPEQGYSAQSFISFLEEVNSKKFDLVLQMHGDGSIVNPMIDLLGAEHVAGYSKPGDYCASRVGYVTYPDDLPEIERHLYLMKKLGIKNKGTMLEFPILSDEECLFQLLCKKYKLKRKEYVCIHAGARDTKRRWSPGNFAKVADCIAARGYTVVLTGTGAEKETVNAVEDLMEFPAVNLAGKTDLGIIAALIRDSKMLFSNDTGVSHIASAVQTPSVVLFLTSDPVRWAPLNTILHRIILPERSGELRFVLSETEKVLLDDLNGQTDMKFSADGLNIDGR